MQIIEYLKQAGACLSKESRLDLEYKLCRSAAEGNQVLVEALISAGSHQNLSISCLLLVIDMGVQEYR